MQLRPHYRPEAHRVISTGHEPRISLRTSEALRHEILLQQRLHPNLEPTASRIPTSAQESLYIEDHNVVSGD